jgi:hypothetical protein
MLHTFRSSKNFLLAHLGHCSECMRTSLWAALAAWALFMAACATAPSAIQTLSGLAALSLSGLWIAHLVAFAWKQAASAPAPAGDGERAARIPSPSRRAFVPMFLRTLALAAAMTALPQAISSAFAQNGPCDGCSRYKGSNTCWTCCSCQNSNCIKGCKNVTDPNKYNTCIGNCSTTFGNCNKACQ